MPFLRCAIAACAIPLRRFSPVCKSFAAASLATAVPVLARRLAAYLRLTMPCLCSSSCLRLTPFRRIAYPSRVRATPRIGGSLLFSALPLLTGSVHRNSFAFRLFAYQSQAAAERSWDMQYRCQSRLNNAKAVPGATTPLRYFALLRQCQAKPCDAIPWQFHSMRFHAVSQRITATPTLNGSKPYRCPSLPCLCYASHSLRISGRRLALPLPCVSSRCLGEPVRCQGTS